ncbi:MAG TPA: c-type cytochrome [Candidatus Kapabacteria bacterium]|nr:c-type cytochrome [Candidatus Kapabacteria bacterium]
MNTLRSSLVIACVAIAGLLGGCATKSDQKSAAADNAAQTKPMTPVERGKYLVTFGGCNDCHTPLKMGANGPEPDTTRLLSGSPEGMVVKAPKLDMPWMAAGSATMTAWAGPWGVSYAHNLTPDSTGLGTWDVTTFILAMRSGKHMGNGRPIMPPMPVDEIGKLNDEDLGAIFAYLKSIPPVKNTPPEYQPPANGAVASN